MDDGELLLVIGPPAAGKMTVGRAVCERAGFRLFHNHHTVEPLLEIFGFGTAPFVALNGEFRRRVIEEAAAAGTRLVRNAGACRIEAKPSKRDLAWSDAHVRELDAAHVMNTDPDRPTPADAVLAGLPHLRLDNSGLAPEEAAERIVAWRAGLDAPN